MVCSVSGTLLFLPILWLLRGGTVGSGELLGFTSSNEQDVTVRGKRCGRRVGRGTASAFQVSFYHLPVLNAILWDIVVPVPAHIYIRRIQPVLRLMNGLLLHTGARSVQNTPFPHLSPSLALAEPPSSDGSLPWSYVGLPG